MQGVLNESINSATITFDEPMAAGAFLASSYSLRDDLDTEITLASVPAVGTESRQVRLQFAEPLPDAIYTLSLGPAVMDLVGNALSGTGLFEFTIDTGTSSTTTLREETRFVTTAGVPVELGQDSGRRTLSFTVDRRFDVTDQTSAVADRLLVSLVNSSDFSQTLLDKDQPGTPLFTLS